MDGVVILCNSLPVFREFMLETFVLSEVRTASFIQLRLILGFKWFICRIAVAYRHMAGRAAGCQSAAPLCGFVVPD